MDKPIKRYTLAYGSNLNKREMLKRCPTALAVCTAVMQNYDLELGVDGRNLTLNIYPCLGVNIPVGIWQLNPDDEKALDLYEEYPQFYSKEWVTLTRDDNGEPIEAYFYKLNKSFLSSTVVPHYYEKVIEGYADWGFNDTIIRKLFGKI